MPAASTSAASVSGSERAADSWGGSDLRSAASVEAHPSSQALELSLRDWHAEGADVRGRGNWAEGGGQEEDASEALDLIFKPWQPPQPAQSALRCAFPSPVQCLQASSQCVDCGDSIAEHMNIVNLHD